MPGPGSFQNLEGTPDALLTGENTQESPIRRLPVAECRHRPVETPSVQRFHSVASMAL